MEVTVLKFRGHKIRLYDGKWFLAKDIAACLGYSKKSSLNSIFYQVPTTWKILKKIKVKSKNGIIQNRKMICISEQGFHLLLGFSRKDLRESVKKYIINIFQGSRNVFIKKIKSDNVRFGEFVKMIRERSWHFARKFNLDYEDVEAQGFLIYCIALEKHDPLKASFSTYLYQNLTGRLQDYCEQYYSHVSKDINSVDLRFETELDMVMIDKLDLLPARSTEPTLEQFMDYAEHYLSSFTFSILKWIVHDRLSGFQSQKNPSLIAMSKKLNIDIDVLKKAWEELGTFWNLRGAAFYSAS